MQPILNRIPEFDERSRNFPIRTLLAQLHELENKLRWSLQRETALLDQLDAQND